MRQLDFFAYHGTDSESAWKIFSSKSFIPGEDRLDHWLGVGSYFYREDDLQAFHWADSKVRYYKSGDPSVLEVKICAPSDKVLHLDTRRGVKTLLDFATDLDANNVRIKLKDKEKYANRIFSMIKPEEAWAIIRTFPGKSPWNKDKNLKKLSFFHKGVPITYGVQGTQVCVKNNEAIDKESIQILPAYNKGKVKVTKSIKKGPIPNEAFNRPRTHS